MGNRVYKYLGPDIARISFKNRDFVTLRCSLPKDFNDPYELFLTIDYNQDPEALAYYREVIGDIPQIPTTCFSRAPDVVPMWAHYARNHEGFIVELDEDEVGSALTDAGFGDIDYRDQPDEEIATQLTWAHTTCKPRHTYFLQRAVFSAAYFTKRTCWSYEQERRLLVKDHDISAEGGLMLVRLPASCISALIAGHRASDELKKSLSQLADETESSYLQMHIGRSTHIPFFTDEGGSVRIFRDGALAELEFTCMACGEPTPENTDTCPWCAIQEDHDLDAARRNPMRMLDHAGMLDRYYQDMERIRRGELK